MRAMTSMSADVAGRTVNSPARSGPGTAGGAFLGAVVLDVELAVLDAEGERLPLVRGEGQHRPVGVLGVAHGDDVVAALFGAGHDRDLHAGTAVPSAVGGLAPRGAGQVHLSIAFLARSVEARGDSASAFSMSYSSANRPVTKPRCGALYFLSVGPRGTL